MNLCHFQRFQHFNPRSLSQIRQKLHKNKLLKSGNFFGFLSFLFSIRDLFHLQNSDYLTKGDYWTTISCFVERFQNSNSRYLSENCIDTSKTDIFCNLSFFGVILGFLGSTKKSRILHNIYRTKLNFCELDSMSNTHKGKFSFGEINCWKNL